MEEKEVFGKGFLSGVCAVFTVNVVFLMVVSHFVGEDAKEVSTLFQLGNAGIAGSTLRQYLVVAVLITLIRQLCFADILFKKMMVLWRTILMLAAMLVMMVVCIICFQWFPPTAVAGWIAFTICFGASFGISVTAMVLKTKWESRRYEEMLKDYKDREEEK